MSSRLKLPSAFAVVMGTAGCACTHAPKPPDVPAALRPPSDQVVYLKALATGTQIYECAPKPTTGGYEWTFKAPEALLTDPTGKAIGKHYGGPTWEANDGSTVVGEVKAKAPSPDQASIPWLLLGAKSNSGSGVLSTARSIQRVDTAGGAAPTTPCDATNMQQITKVPYTATYYFYRQTS